MRLHQRSQFYALPSTILTMLQSPGTQDHDGLPPSSAGLERPLGRASIPSLRGRASPLKFFASSSVPKPKDQHDSHHEWEKNYLQDLRSNRPTRPSGARDPPGRIPILAEPTNEAPLRASSAMSVRPSLPLRQSSPRRIHDQERCSSALSQRQEVFHTSSPIPVDAHQSCSPRKLNHAAMEVERRPLAQAYSEGTRARDLSSATRISSGVYRERGQRLVEKEEARMLREALQLVDLQAEARLDTAAQAEASELVWTHQNPKVASEVSDAPYLYKERLLSTSHGRSQSDGPNSTAFRPKEDRARVKRSVSERLKVEHAGSDGEHASKVSTVDEGKNSLPGRAETQEPSQEVTSPKAVDELVNHSATFQSQPENVHALWDSPQKKAYMDLSFSLPKVRSHGRRRSSGSKIRTPSGSLFRNPNDKIYEEPAEIKQEANPPKSSGEMDAAPLRSMTREPITKFQTTSQPYLRTMTDLAEGKGRYTRTEIHRNPPSQSRNPSYLQNEGPPAPGDQMKDDKLQITESGTKNGVEIRSNDIRAATSMRLRDRSPKLPSPTVVSNAKERPIVSFDKNWTPSQVNLQPQDSLQQHHSMHDEGLLASTTARSKPPLLESTVSAPAIPTINVPEPPSIQIDEVPPVPSIRVSAVPSISISAEEQSSDSSVQKTKSSRPLPIPSRKTLPQTSGRPLPHHSSTAPVRSSVPHWSPAQRRATAQCAGCALPISGRVVRASSQGFHPECFTCFHCSEQLECVAFYPEPDNFRNDRVARIRARAEGLGVPEKPGKSWEDDGDESLRFYCHLDFHEKFSPRCRSCETPIEGEVIVACGGEWHAGHFFCAQCGDPFDQKTPFVEKDGYAWCVGCHTNRFSGKCRGCKKAVVDLVVRALGGEWHEGCFCCKVGSAPSRLAHLKRIRTVLIRISYRNVAALSKMGGSSQEELRRCQCASSVRKGD